jgi:hypothetical protein
LPPEISPVYPLLSLSVADILPGYLLSKDIPIISLDGHDQKKGKERKRILAHEGEGPGEIGEGG